MFCAKIDSIDRTLFFATLLSAVMLMAVLVRYPSDPRHEKLALIGLALIALSATLAFLLGNKPPFAGEGKALGARVGIIAGLLWVIEISFNNFVDPRVSTGRARFYVDNAFWAAIALAILVSSLAAALNTRKVSSGLRVGLWSGYVSGIIACLMALSLILFGMRFLLRDPLNISEYATRAHGSSAGGMAAYFAYETMAGALGHLFVLGVVMGLLLGLIGGLAGALLARFRTPSSATM